ncbi:MAG: hypothetical protein WCI61_01270 [Chloroflexota bacterium]
MPSTIPDQSMTTFVDYVAASGPSRIAVVRKALKRVGIPYDRAKDYWRIFRDSILAFHRGEQSLERLSELLQRATPKKANNYERRAATYKKWLGRKHVVWFQPERRTWEYGLLRITVNPELGLTINGTRHIIKMYLRQEKPTKRQLAAALHLLNETFADEVASGAVVGILDVESGKLITAGPQTEDLAVLLQADAVSFVAVWQLLTDRSEQAA